MRVAMSPRPAKITQTEISRTLKAAAEAGFEVGRWVVNHQTGEVTVFAKGAEPRGGAAEIDRMLEIR